MKKFLIESQMKYRVGTMEEADQLEQHFRSNESYIVKSFKKQQKSIKHKEKVGKETVIEVEDYILCTVTLIFNDEKEPISLTDLRVSASYCVGVNDGTTKTYTDGKVDYDLY